MLNTPENYLKMRSVVETELILDAFFAECHRDYSHQQEAPGYLWVRDIIRDSIIKIRGVSVGRFFTYAKFLTTRGNTKAVFQFNNDCGALKYPGRKKPKTTENKEMRGNPPSKTRSVAS